MSDILFLKDYAKFDGSLSERDHLAIRKTFSGMVKLLYPDGNMTDQEAYELIDFAAESVKVNTVEECALDERSRYRLKQVAIFQHIGHSMLGVADKCQSERNR
mgnify:CR=1 FL=1